MYILCGTLLMVVVVGTIRLCNRPKADQEELEQIMNRMDDVIMNTKEDGLECVKQD